MEELDRIALEANCARVAILLAGTHALFSPASVVVGVEQAAQLKPHLRTIDEMPLPPEVVTSLNELSPDLENDILDPGRWPRYMDQR